MKNNFNGLEIAIIGMAGRFPGAKNIREFWDNLKNGVESIPFLSEEEIVSAGEEPGNSTDPRYIKTRGGLVEEAEYFEAEFFGYTPLEAEVIAPQTRVFHEVCWEALEDAGYDPEIYDGAIGLYAGGRNSFDWQALALLSGKSAQLGEVLSSTLYDKDNMTFRVSYRLNLGGPVISLNTACSTALTAVHLASQGLLSAESDMALAGAAAITVTRPGGYFYQEGDVMSPDGHTRAFDSRAAGLVYSDGAGVVLLKTLEDALAAGDHIYALIKGSAVNNDGHNKVSFTAPAVKSQEKVIRAAQHMAEVDPESITYVEAHGTGTPVGDPIEIRALKQAFHSQKKHFCAIGSVKTNVGHMTEAAGLGGLIKTVLALKHRCLPPSLHYQDPNPALEIENSPFYINRELKTWENGKNPLRAGVSSFGRGGTNVHIILEEWPARQSAVSEATPALILFSARTRPALQEMTRSLAAYFRDTPGTNLQEAAYTLQVGRKAFVHRARWVGSEINEAVEALSSAHPRKIRTSSAKEDDRPLVFIFPGLGSQYVGMGQGLYETEPLFRREMDRCIEILDPLLENPIKEILYPGIRSNRANRSDIPGTGIDQIEAAQVAVFIFGYSLARLLQQWGIRPEAMIGYSFGEYTAAVTAGVLSLEDALEIIVLRGRLIRRQPPGVMMSVPLSREQLEPLLTDPQAAIAIDNGQSCVVSGPARPIADLERRLKEKRFMSTPLDSTHALHSPMMEPVMREFENVLARYRCREPQIPYISNVTGDWITAEQVRDPAYWSKHLRETVCFARGLEVLAGEGRAVFIEIGPGRQLSALVARAGDPAERRPVVNLEKPEGSKIDDLNYLLNKIGDIWLYGAKIDWNAFNTHRQKNRVSMPTYPFQRMRRTIVIPKEIQSWKQIYAGETGETALPPHPRTGTEKEVNRPNLLNPYEAPANEIEQILAAIWQELLGYKDIGSEDDFLELGGDSLKAITVLNRVQKEYNVFQPLNEFFKNPTIKAQSAYILQAEKISYKSVSPAETREYYPLSSIQERLYILQQMDLQSVGYNLPQVYIITGKIQGEKLAGAIRALIRRHEILRTSFPEVHDQPVQKIHEEVQFEIENYNPVSPHPINDDNPNARRAIKSFDQTFSKVWPPAGPPEATSELAPLSAADIISSFIRPFELTRAPLLRAGLIKLGEDEHIFMVDTHHIVSDGVSNQVFIQEFFISYAGEELPAAVLQYKDYTQWRNSPDQQQVLDRQEIFWKKELEGRNSRLDLPADFPRPGVRNFAGSRVSVEIPGQETGKLKDMAKEESTTLYMVLLSIFNVLLAKISGREDIVIGIDTAGRSHADVQEMIGVFINTLVLKTYAAENKTFQSFLREITLKTLEIFENQDYPFDKLVETLEEKREPGRNPIFDVMFSYESFQIKPLEIPAGAAHLAIKPWGDESRMSKLELNVKITIGETLGIIFEYSTELYKEKTVQRYANYFREIAAAVIKNRNTRLADIELAHHLLAAPAVITPGDLEF